MNRAILAVCLCCLVRAQDFEVASIKSSPAPGRGPIRTGARGGPAGGDPGRISYTFSTIRDLIAEAYSVRGSQISGGPNWLDSEHFDIVAKVPEGATKEQVKLMLRNLLAERFQLALHHETKEMPLYALVPGPKGLKMKESGTADAQSSGPPSLREMKMGSDGCPETAVRAGFFTVMTPGGECLISNGQTVESLAEQLSKWFDRPVIDQSGIKGQYDLRLRYDPSSLPGARLGPVMRKEGAAAGADAPTIFSALQEQAGLKLVTSRGMVELLVIDHVEKRPAP